ncbi:hypothetical protein GCM10010329_86630 [Streptomyces spiroverticillatus]|uniref:Uncharacterized protein n=1 Tax=Streptomyces finlayi TaxID=67296 RepID=A0A919CG66_9ACTN|nr:hypothetical protein GCM10010329_86630 [Streptomyces spiroverticillatus]GHD20322.1 hypothetical protein GCM10010334_84580 [Streptomyces finlayi]
MGAGSWWAVLACGFSSGEGEVVLGGDGLHGVARSLLAAVAEDLPVLHPGDGVLGPGPHLVVRGVVNVRA